jgi:hypothetical protein
MTISSGDLLIFQSQVMTDDAFGGGRVTGTAVQDGVSNNIFPDVSLTDRASGAQHLRKVYAAVVSDERDALLGAHVALTAQPTDPDIDTVAFLTGDHLTLRAAAKTFIEAAPFYPVISTGDNTGGVLVTSQPDGEIRAPDTWNLEVGDLLAIAFLGVAVDSTPTAVVRLTGFVTNAGGYDEFTYVAEWGTVPNKANWLNYRVRDWCPVATRAIAGFAELDVAASATDTEIEVSRVMARVTPSTAGLYEGEVPIFRPGGIVYLEDGANKELVVVDRVLFDGRLRFTTGLVNAYGVGAKVCSVLSLGDLQASVGPSFAQQTWTRTFSDSIIGSPAAGNYNRATYPILTTNEGAATEKWAIIFTGATTFKLVGENVGQIATGDTATDFLPLNPYTNQPYFTIDKDGWGTGWLTGNVLRFNTVAAQAPIWVNRSVNPSAPGAGTDQTELTLRGSVNA